MSAYNESFDVDAKIDMMIGTTSYNDCDDDCEDTVSDSE